jgi:hypothetical protein
MRRSTELQQVETVCYWVSVTCVCGLDFYGLVPAAVSLAAYGVFLTGRLLWWEYQDWRDGYR